MVTVPNTSGRTVQPDTLQPGYSSVRASPAAFGAARAEALGALAQGVEDVGNVSTNIVLKNLQQDNRRKAVELDNNLSDQLRKILQEGENGQPGYYGQLGENAIDAYDSTTAKIRQLRAQTIAQAPNQAVRDMVAPAIDARLSSAMDGIDSHVNQQRKNANDAADAARISTSAADAAAAWNSPQAIAQSLGIAKSTALTMADRNGIKDPVVRNAQVVAASSTVLRATIDAAMLTDVKRAEQIFAAHKDEIDGITQSKIQQDLMIQQRAEQAQRDHEIAMADRARAKAVQAATDEWTTKITDPNSDVSIQDFTHDPRLAGEGGQKVFLLNLLKATDKTEPATAVSAKTTQDLVRRMTLPEGDPDAITSTRQIDQAFVAGGLTRSDRNFAVQVLSQQQTPDGRTINSAVNQFTAAMKSTISQSTLMKSDAQGDLRFYYFTQKVYKAIADAQQAGKNPYSLLDPNSPDYLGKPALMKPYLADPSTDVQSLTNPLRGEGEKNIPSAPEAIQATPKAEELAKKFSDQTATISGASADERVQAGRALVTEAYQKGEITYDEAAQILRKNGWAK